MKVCIVSPHVPSDDAIGLYTAQIAAELCKKAEVVVLANKGPNLPTLSRIEQNEGGCHYTVLRIWSPSLFYPFTIFREIVRQKPDVVHAQHEYFLYGKGLMGVLFLIVLLLTRLCQVPLVVTMHHVIPRERADVFRDFIRIRIPVVAIKAFLTFFNGFFSISNKIVVASTAFEQTLSIDYKISDKKIEVVQHFASPNKPNVGEDNSLNAKRRLRLYGKTVALFFGYIRPDKGIEYVLYSLPDVIRIFPNVIFSVVGKAQPNYHAYFDFIQRLVDKLELSQYVRFENYVPEELLPVFFTAADVVIFPYTSTIGRTPIAHLNVASHGKPIIATNIDCFEKDFTDHENAILIPPKNPDALSKSIIEVFADPTLSNRLSINVTKYCSQRSLEKAISHILEIYHDVLERKQGY